VFEPIIEAAYGFDPASTTIVRGKAEEAIDGEKTSIRADLVILSQPQNCSEPDMEHYGWLWKHLGRLAHYIADVHSPFHPNSFGIVEEHDDYHEGILDPTTGTWAKGLFDRGIGGQLVHGMAELSMGSSAATGQLGVGRIFDISCDDPEMDGPMEPIQMAQEAASKIDEYQATIATGWRGYLGVLKDFELPSGGRAIVTQAIPWGPERVKGAIGSIKKVFDELLDPLQRPNCDDTACNALTKPPDTPDETASSAGAVDAQFEDPQLTQRVLDAFNRTASKKGKKQLIGWQLISSWLADSWRGRITPQRQREYTDALAYRSDDSAYFRDYVASADVSVLGNGFMLQASDLVESRFLEPIMRVKPHAVGPGHLGDHPVLVIPSGGLLGFAQNEQFKAGLELYVREGGTAVVFSQQHGSDYAVLPTPDGQPIRGWGWLEDNSCYWNAAYVETMHPILASQSQALVTSSIDGYFDGIPENATVLLRRVKNGLPAMFMYPYGAGWVIVSSSYDDWGGFNQSSPGARAIIRDAVAWAKRPADLPMNAPGTTVSLTLQVKNVTPLAASQVRLILVSPSRDRLIAEETRALTVPAGSTASVDYSYTFPANAELGIYHVDYELLDEAGITVQPVAEEDTGRIVIARPAANPYRPSDMSLSVVMPGGEDVLGDRPVTFRYRLENRSASERRFRIYWDLRHGAATLDGEVLVAGQSVLVRDLTVQPARAGFSLGRFWIHVFEEGGTPHPRVIPMSVGAETAAYQLSDGKGFRVHVPRTTVGVATDRSVYADGQTATVTVTVKNEVSLAWAGTVRLVQDASRPELNGEQPVTLGPEGTATLTFMLPLPAKPPLAAQLLPVPWSATFFATVLRDGAVVGRGQASVQVVQPDLRTVMIAPPAWSRSGPNVVTWTLENTQPVPLASGSVRAVLAYGAQVVADQTQALMVAERGQASVTFTLPALPPNWTNGTLRLSADNGFGRGPRLLLAAFTALLPSVSFSTPEFSARDGGEVVLKLRNAGTILEEREVSGSIDGIGSLSPLAFAIAPGQETTLRFPFDVPSDVVGGLHQGSFQITNGAPVHFSLPVKKPKLELSVEDRTYNVGEALSVTVRNVGGSRASPRVQVDFGELVSAEETFTLEPGAEASVTLPPLPSQLRSGSYVLRALASDGVNGAFVGLSRTLRVAGTSATLTLATDKPVYAPGVPLVASARVVNSGAALEDGVLFLEIVKDDGECGLFTFWGTAVPLDLDPGAAFDFGETLTGPFDPGHYIFSGTVRNGDGAELAAERTNFEVVETGLGVSITTDRPRYRAGSPVQISGVVRNLGSAEEPDVLLTVASGDTLLEETLTLGPGEERAYTVTTTASDGETEVEAVLSRDGARIVRGKATYRGGTPQVAVDLLLPDPPVRIDPTSARLVAALEADMDAVTKTDDGVLEGPLPFPVPVGTVVHDRFRQSVDGFVELIPVGQSATELTGDCLEELVGGTFLAGVLGDLDASASGFVGHKLYAAGSQDASGRVFPTDTLVFFWNAPANGDDPDRRNRFQALLARDGLMRVDAETVYVPTTCSQSGLVFGGSVVSLSPPAPFGLRLEGDVGRNAFAGKVLLSNFGGFEGTVTLVFGREGEPPLTEAVTLATGESREVAFPAVGAGTYTVTATGDTFPDPPVELTSTVSSSEALVVGFEGSGALVPGPAALPVTLWKHGGVSGPVEVTFTLTGPAGSETVVRTYDPEPGTVVTDAIPFTIPEGSLTLRAAADGVPVDMPEVALLAAPEVRVTLTANPGPVTSGALPISVDVANTGLSAFEGEIQVEGPGASRTAISVPAGSSTHLDLPATLTGAPAGAHELVVRLVSAAGVLLAEERFTQDVAGSRVVLVESPAGAVFEPGTTAALQFVLENRGDQPASGAFRFSVFDEEHQASFNLLAGEQTAVDVALPIDVNVPEKVYAGRYVIEVGGQVQEEGQVNFTVTGIALAVEATLDREAYSAGETARLTLRVTNSRPLLGTDYLARVHYGGFEEVRTFTVTGETTLVFDIPLPAVTGEAAFVGIAHPDGTSLYINTLHVRASDALLTLTLDQQVYAPGASVTVTAQPATGGTLTLSAPGFEETLPVTGGVTRSFTLPADLPGGTYFVAWTLVTTDGRSAAGSVPFDVAGLRVRVLEASLDSGRYATGESITTRLRINTNQPTSATLRAFVLDPDGSTTAVGETTVALEPEADLVSVASWPFTSSVAGLHLLVYSLYQAETALASGSLAFDVGSGAVLGVRTDRSDYPDPGAQVTAIVSAFVSTPSSLRIEIDGTPAVTREITALGMVDVSLVLPGVAPGLHELAAVIDVGGYTSRRSTHFALGSALPDLVTGAPSARSFSLPSWKVDVAVSNAGHQEAPPTSLTVADLTAGRTIGTAAVPALAPGASTVISLDWDVSGLAGAHQLEAVADSGDAVVEFREDNNHVIGIVEIPSLVIQATAASSYPSGVEADLGASVANLTADTTATGLSVSSTVRRPDGTSIPLGTVRLDPLGPGVTVVVGTPWAIERATPGLYVLGTELLRDTGASIATSFVGFDVLPTLTFGGSVSAQPSPARPGESVTFTGRIENRGNVAASGTAVFEVVSAMGTVVASATASAEVPLDGVIDVTATLGTLDVNPGDYALHLDLEVEGQRYAVARAPLTVVGAGVEASLAVDPSPRVLVYVGGSVLDPAGRARRRSFVEASLAEIGALHKVTSDPLEFGRLVRSGTWNTFVVLTDVPLLLPLLADELREAGFRGDGLVLVQWRAGSSPALTPALGARVEGELPGKIHTLTVIDGPLGPAQTVTVPGRAARLSLQGAQLVGTLDAGTPGLTVHSFGRGRSVVMSFDPGVAPSDANYAALSRLFARAVAYSAPRESRAAAAGTVLPLAVSLANSGAASQEIEVTVGVPAGVRLASVDDSPVQGDPPTWRTTLPAGGSGLLRFQVVLPDDVGIFTITTSVNVNGVPLANSPSFTLEVPRTTDTTLADAITALEAKDVRPDDEDDRDAAVALLRVVQGASTDAVGLELRIRLTAEAGQKLGRIQTADVTQERTDLGRLIAAWERMQYDLITSASRERAGVRAAGLESRRPAWALALVRARP
jgi:methionine-rich copper-binding protein CopC